MVGNVAAANAAVKAKKRREKLEKRALEAEAQLDAWFGQYDTNKTGTFDREEMRNVLTDVKRQALGNGADAVRDELLDKIMATYAVVGSPREIGRNEVLTAVKKYRGILKDEAYMRDLFERHDADKSGALPAEQLLALLTEVAKTELPHKYASQEDVEFVLARADHDKSGSISIDELSTAISTWKEVAKDVTPESSSTCVLL